MSTRVITEWNTKACDFRGITMSGLIALSVFQFYGFLDLTNGYYNTNLFFYEKFTQNSINIYISATK